MSPPEPRPEVRGKFLWSGSRKLWVCGVTYGTFRPAPDGSEYGDPESVARDFGRMAAVGVNAVRTYTVPPRWLLDTASRHGLRVMVGLPWEQHVAFLDDRARPADIERRVAAGVRACAGHPAVLCYAVGNEIPGSIVRWHGRRRVERFLRRLYLAAKAEDPGGLVTYVNFPTTEYLELPFLDLACFNVYLESEDRYAAYVARLHNLVGDRPLLMAELGLDSRRNGLEAQAASSEWQLRRTFAAGCAGAFVFSWTDRWHRGGFDIEDWDFGLTDREGRPKPALYAAQRAFAQAPFAAAAAAPPRISVVVCTHNGSATIMQCCEHIARLQYPDWEAIVVDDGSRDHAAVIARRFGFRVISTENRGLSSARNTGLAAATGDIVAYVDDDAFPDPHWLSYLAAAFAETGHIGIGGPNIPPPGDGPIADCVANAPGGPVHVLLTDTVAEHIPGCNMAFRKAGLEAVGGFDPQFRAAGDDVDICWRLQERGWTLGFSPAAVVWHHRRNSLRAYWKQQWGYGRAEAMLETKWPARYNAAGHVAWAGRLYGPGLTLGLPRRHRVYQGTWGSAPFQAVYPPRVGVLGALTLMPEWYLVLAGVGALALVGVAWPPLLLLWPLFVLGVGASLVQAGLSAARARFVDPPTARWRRAAQRVLVALLHLAQPAARLGGRLATGLSPWRRRGTAPLALPRSQVVAVWSEQWRGAAQWLEQVEAVVAGLGAVSRRGGEFDEWDLQVRGGMAGGARLRLAVEEHGGGRQLLRFRLRPWWPLSTVAALGVLGGLALGAALDGAATAAGVLGTGALLLAGRAAFECAVAVGQLRRALPASD